MKINYIFSIIILTRGVILAYKVEWSKIHCKCKVKAIVIDFDCGFPVFEFYVNDEKIQVSFWIKNTPSNYKIGDIVEIYYNCDDPQEIFISTYKYYGWIVLIAFVIGALIFYYGE